MNKLTEEQTTVSDLGALWDRQLIAEMTARLAKTKAMAEACKNGGEYRAQIERHIAILERMLSALSPSSPAVPSDELRLLEQKAFAFDEFAEKTKWVQENMHTFSTSALGKHYVDVMREEIERLRAIVNSAPPSQVDAAQPIDMILHCPKCGLQHVDAPEWEDDPHDIEHGQMRTWANPPHRSHLCHGCGHIWRPADVPTNGVAAIKTKGKADSPIADAAQIRNEALEQAKEIAGYTGLAPQNELERAYMRGREDAADDIAALQTSPNAEQEQPKVAVEVGGQDLVRLEFMMEHGAWIAWGKDGESCRVFHCNDDGECLPMLGWGARHWRHDPREAIDAAMAHVGYRATASSAVEQPVAGAADVGGYDERALFNEFNNDTDCPLAGLDAKQAGWRAWQARAAHALLARTQQSEQDRRDAEMYRWLLERCMSSENGLMTFNLYVEYNDSHAVDNDIASARAAQESSNGG